MSEDMKVSRRTMIAAAGAVGFSAVAGAAISAGAAEKPKFFPPALNVKKIDPNGSPPDGDGLGYVSGSSGGAFTLFKKQGHASFRWNHELEVDWHDSDTRFEGVATDDSASPSGPKYWVYSLTYDHEGHKDKVFLYFAQDKNPLDAGFRIFFGHSDNERPSTEPPEPKPHDIHLWCVDAQRYGFHHGHSHDGVAESAQKKQFRMFTNFK